MKSLDKILKMYVNSDESHYMRLGQWFYFKFGIKTPIITLVSNTDLFYETDTSIAKTTIKKWLTDHHYFETIPPIRIY